jgi:hypothetical protein
VKNEASIGSKAVRDGIPAWQAGMSGESQAESECDLKKQTQFAGCPEERKDFANNELRCFCRLETPQKQSQTNPNTGLWPETQSTKCDKSGAFSGCLLPGVGPEILDKNI